MGIFNKSGRVASFVKRFRTERSGGVALMAGFAFPVLFIGAGGAIDYSNAVNTTQKAQRVMDSTVLALTRIDLEGADVQAEGERLFTSLMAQQTLMASPTSISFSLKKNVISGSAVVESKTFFLGYVGMAPMEGLVESAAVPPINRPIEISLVLDVSGSMNTDLNGLPRIQRLKNSVNRMFDTLDESLPNGAKLSAAVVPYSTSVNVGNFPGALKTLSVGGAPKPTGGVDIWAAERDVPSSGLHWNVTDAGPGTDPVDFVTAAEIGNANPKPRLIPLTDKIEDVRASVNGMTAAGYTAGHIGMEWGVYSLSNKWKSLWPQEPAKRDEADKIIVILSDGEFNTTHNIGDTRLEIDPTTHVNPARQTPYKNDNQEESDAYFQNICTLARDKGMTIYAVALALDPVSEAKLGTCVGVDGKLYKADSATDLSNAFKDIARRLGSHRLTS